MFRFITFNWKYLDTQRPVNGECLGAVTKPSYARAHTHTHTHTHTHIYIYIYISHVQDIYTSNEFEKVLFKITAASPRGGNEFMFNIVAKYLVNGLVLVWFQVCGNIDYHISLTKSVRIVTSFSQKLNNLRNIHHRLDWCSIKGAMGIKPDKKQINHV